MVNVLALAMLSVMGVVIRLRKRRLARYAAKATAVRRITGLIRGMAWWNGNAAHGLDSAHPPPMCSPNAAVTDVYPSCRRLRPALG